MSAENIPLEPLETPPATPVLAGGVYDAARILAQPDDERKLITINLLRDHSLPTVAPATAAPSIVAPKPPTSPPPLTTIAPKKHALSLPLVLAGLAVLVILSVGAVFAYAARSKQLAGRHPDTAPPVISTPSPSPSPSATPSPSPSPTPSPAPIATAAPKAETITAPKEAPTAEHPQTVTIKSSSGLWLRSSPTSENRSNIIGWMPNGASISVDSVGEFWWHGTYKGQTGYFASTYTK